MSQTDVDDDTPTSEAVLELVDEHVDVDDPWTSRSRLETRARAADCPVDADDVDDAIPVLEDVGMLVYWNGQITLPREELLTAAIEQEAASEFPRRVLIGQLNKLRQELNDE